MLEANLEVQWLSQALAPKQRTSSNYDATNHSKSRCQFVSSSGSETGPKQLMVPSLSVIMVEGISLEPHSGLGID